MILFFSQILLAETLVEPIVLQGWLDGVVLLTNNGAFCSGSVINETGLVLTAYHCVASGRDTAVQTRKGTVYRAETIAVDPRHDLALIQVDAVDQRWNAQVTPLIVSPIAPVQGEVVLAMGHPLAPYARKPLLKGTLQWSVVHGMVAAVGERLIQVDVPLNPGNSGGPIVSTEGQIVGVASRKLRGNNLSFLGPATEVQQMIDEPKHQAWWGGQLNLGVAESIPLNANGMPIFTGHVEGIARDRWVLGAETMLQPKVQTTTDTQWLPANSLRFSRRFRWGVGETTGAVDVGMGVTHQWYPQSNAHTLLPTLHIRNSIGGIGLRIEGGTDASRNPVVMMAVEMQLPGVVNVF